MLNKHFCVDIRLNLCYNLLNKHIYINLEYHHEKEADIVMRRGRNYKKLHYLSW